MLKFRTHHQGAKPKGSFPSLQDDVVLPLKYNVKNLKRFDLPLSIGTQLTKQLRARKVVQSRRRSDTHVEGNLHHQRFIDHSLSTRSTLPEEEISLIDNMDEENDSRGYF